MNARIKELVNLASEYADHYDKIGVDHSYQNIFNEKFAELIIRECTNLFADQQNMIVNPNKPFAYRTVRALQENDKDTVRKIREHFGV